MTWEEWIKLLEQQYSSSKSSQPDLWSYAYAERERNPDPQLANAEHYLYGRKLVQQDPMNAIKGYLFPMGYYGAKKTGLMSGRSQPSIEQMLAGMRGIWDETWE